VLKEKLRKVIGILSLNLPKVCPNLTKASINFRGRMDLLKASDSSSQKQFIENNSATT